MTISITAGNPNFFKELREEDKKQGMPDKGLLVKSTGMYLCIGFYKLDKIGETSIYEARWHVDCSLRDTKKYVEMAALELRKGDIVLTKCINDKIGRASAIMTAGAGFKVVLKGKESKIFKRVI